MSVCKGCKGKIVWGRTQRGRGLPLDPRPDDNGTMMDTGDRTPGGEIIVRPARSDEVGVRWMNHFDSCPTPDSFRRS